MANANTERFIKALQQAEQQKNSAPLVEIFCSDAKLQNMVRKESSNGDSSAGTFWREYLEVFDHIHSQFTTVLEQNDNAVLEWEAEGALATGQPISYRGVSIVEFVDGHVKNFRTYYNSAAFLPDGAKKSA